MSVSSSVKFSELTGLLEKISKLLKPNEKQELLTRFINYWRELSGNGNSDDITNTNSTSFYPILRLLLPHLDKLRPVSGIKEWTLAKLYCDILCIGENSADAKNLFHYDRGVGDLADMAYKVLRMRCGGTRLLTIEEVNLRLDNIANASGPNRKEVIKENLIFMQQNSSALDQKWLIRMILRHVPFGMTQKTILKCYHPSAEELYNVTTDLSVVCSRIRSYGDTVPTIELQLFKPFKPMLSARGDVRTIVAQLDNVAFIHETKFDGERVQLHKDGDLFRYWSRNGLEWTKSYGLTRQCGTLTPFIADLFKSSVVNCILDGEMMGYNNATRKMGSKTEEFDIKHANVERLSGYLPCFVVFDLLYLNGAVLTGHSVLERKRLLGDHILQSEMEGKIQIAKYGHGVSRNDCVTAFNAAIDNCDEGIVVKRTDSTYHVNSRKAGWFKIKPDYVLGLHEELDCVIVGGYFSSGKIIGHFLCAVKLEDTDRYYSFCRVGSGFTRKVLYDFNNKMAPHWKEYDKKNAPQWLILSPKFREKPDICIEPCNSFIIQLKAAEIVSSENYATKCTLRFPRIDCFREDKSPIEDCMTLSELNHLRSQHKGKLALHPLEIDSETEEFVQSSSKPNKRRMKRRYQLPESLRSEVPQKRMVSDDILNTIFTGKELCILISQKAVTGLDKKKAENFVYDNGGSIVQNPSKDTTFVIADRQTVKIQNLMKSNSYDILTVDWLSQCIEDKRFPVLKPCHYISMKLDTVKYFNDIYDKFGDSFTEETSVEELKNFLHEIETKNFEVPLLRYEDRSMFLDSIRCDDLDSTFMNGCVIHFYLSTENGGPSVVRISEIKRMRIGLTLCGARVVDDVSVEGISHVVLSREYTTTDIRSLQALNKELNLKFFILSFDWAVTTLEKLARTPERSFMVKI